MHLSRGPSQAVQGCDIEDEKKDASGEDLHAGSDAGVNPGIEVVRNTSKEKNERLTKNMWINVSSKPVRLNHLVRGREDSVAASKDPTSTKNRHHPSHKLFISFQRRGKARTTYTTVSSATPPGPWVQLPPSYRETVEQSMITADRQAGLGLYLFTHVNMS